MVLDRHHRVHAGRPLQHRRVEHVVHVHQIRAQPRQQGVEMGVGAQTIVRISVLSVIPTPLFFDPALPWTPSRTRRPNSLHGRTFLGHHGYEIFHDYRTLH